MKFLFTFLVALPLLGTIRAKKEEALELERRSSREADELQNNNALDLQRRDDDDEDNYVLMCTRDTRKGCVKVHIQDIGK